MICQECSSAGQESRVTLHGLRTTTLAGRGPFHDEGGNYHYHDPNTITTFFTCSNGHEGTISSRTKCPSCDYGEGDDEVSYNSQAKEHGK